MECPICFERYTRPISLACGHTYCEAHLDEMSGCAMRCAAPAGAIPPRGERHVNIAIQQLVRSRRISGSEAASAALSSVLSGVEPFHRGRHSAVYRCEYQHRSVAIKQLADSPQRALRLAAFTEIGAIVHNLQGFVRTISVLPPPMGCIITPWCEHGDLRRALDRWGAPPMRIVKSMLICIATTLGQLHAQGIVHGDLRASHLLLQGGPTITDDAASSTDDAASLWKELNGLRWPLMLVPFALQPTPNDGYALAPEVTLAGRLGPRADSWGWAAVAHEILSACSSIDGVGAETVLGMAEEEEEYAGAACRELNGLTQRCFNTDSRQRPSMATIIDEVRRLPTLRVSVHDAENTLYLHVAHDATVFDLMATIVGAAESEGRSGGRSVDITDFRLLRIFRRDEPGEAVLMSERVLLQERDRDRCTEFQQMWVDSVQRSRSRSLSWIIVNDDDDDDDNAK